VRPYQGAHETAPTRLTVERESAGGAGGDVPVTTERSTSVPAFVAPDREAIKARFRARLAEADRERSPAKVLIAHFRAQWMWLGIADGQPVELQQLAPTAPDEEIGAALRAKNRLDPSKGEFRPANRYARVHDLRHALKLLHDAAENFQCQGQYIIGNRLKKAVADKAKVNVWISFAKDSGTTDPDIAGRCVLMLDIDPRRQDGVKDISATADERQHAVERALDLYVDLVEMLGSEGSLALVSSGNGAQVHVRVDMPNTPEVTRIVKRLLLVLDQLYSTDTEELDTAVFDAKRLFPACGTLKRKGANNPVSGRVHRASHFLPGVKTPDVLSGDDVGRLLSAFEARLTSEQRAAVETDMGTAHSRPSPGATAASARDLGESDFAKANAASVGDVVRKLGLDPDHLACPACGATSNVDSLESKGLNIIKCPHATCGGRAWRPVDLVAKLAFACDDLKGSKGVAAQVLGWFADNFGIDIKRPKKSSKPTAEEKAESDQQYRNVIAELRARAAQRDASEPALGREEAPPDPFPADAEESVGSAPPEPEATPAEPCPAPSPPATEPLSLSDDEIDQRLWAVVGRSALEQETAINALHRDTKKTKTALRARLKELATERDADATEGGGPDDVLGEVLEGVKLVAATNCRIFALFDDQVIPADSPRLRSRIAYLYNQRCGARIGPTAIEAALAPLLGADIPHAVVPVRYAWGTDGTIWVDLGRGPRSFVHVTASAVTVESVCPVRFYRPGMMAPMPTPVIPADDAACAAVFEETRAHFQIDRPQLATTFAWGVGALRPGEPERGGKLTEYLVLTVTGAQGSGKTTFADSWSQTVDSKATPHFKLPRDDEGLAVLAENARALVFNNLSNIPQWMSDSLCELADGSGMVLRSLYTNRDTTVFLGSNAVCLVSIGDVALAPDLLDRSLSVSLPERTEYIEPEQVEAAFLELWPRLLGALLYCAGRALRDSAAHSGHREHLDRAS